jgi:hypothetical protein
MLPRRKQARSVAVTQPPLSVIRKYDDACVTDWCGDSLIRSGGRRHVRAPTSPTVQPLEPHTNLKITRAVLSGPCSKHGASKRLSAPEDLNTATLAM